MAGEDQGHEPKRTTGSLDYVSFPVFPKARLHLELKKKGRALRASAVSEIDGVSFGFSLFFMYGRF